MKFKVGDKVKICNGTLARCWGFNPYKVYEVKGVNKNSKTVDLTNEDGQNVVFHFNRIEHVEPKKTKNQRIAELEKKVASLVNRVEGLEKKVESLEFVLAEQSKITKLENGKNSPSTAKELAELWSEQPSTNEIIEFEGNQYRKVERGAKVGDYVSVPFSIGECFKPNKIYGPVYEQINGLAVKADSSTGEEEYEEALVYNDIYERTPETVDVYELIKEEKSPNQQRAEIIEKAKKFVEKYQAVRKNDEHHEEGNGYAKYYWYETDFFVKGNKVTAVLYGLDYGVVRKKVPLAVGRAKCAPGDVFNKYIGMAIALGRALGLDVSEFENAVQPTKPVVGMLFETMGGEIREIGSSDFYSSQSGKSALKSQAVRDRKRIVDDSIARY